MSQAQPLPGREVLEHALSLLAAAGVASGDIAEVSRYAVSADARFCALTLSNYLSYVVDLQARTYLYFPTAGVVGFSASHLLLSPDEERFSLEYSGFDSFEVDLQSADLPWLACGGEGSSPASTSAVAPTP